MFKRQWLLPLSVLVLIALACNSTAQPVVTPLPAEPTSESTEPPPDTPQPEATLLPETPLPQATTPPRSDSSLPLNSDPPAAPVRLIFIHHSTGGNWLADPASNEVGGDLGRALMDNNYFVSATNYGWGPDSIGDRTDIGNWWEWFLGPSSDTYLSALYSENGQNFGDFGSWPQLATDPGGENEVVLFKSCFPNSALQGNPDDAPTTGDNPLQGQDAGSEYHTVANAKGIYNDLLTYFAAHQDKLFIVITAPPLVESSTSPEQAANARAFNLWLINEWLQDYAYNNVAVFDFYNVLTSKNNHHRYQNGAIEYITDKGGDYSAYGQGDDSHPNAAGNKKAAGEFVPLLNIAFHCWRGDGGCPPLMGRKTR